ncbi:hypothetical protein ACJIZ3_019735 [Penstemon smallii]|uniref:Uncharacterized protein n=1 Tax=Penstemon smallii TaxID=265156 RepID=A0ABD3T2P9_9LAMI
MESLQNMDRYFLESKKMKYFFQTEEEMLFTTIIGQDVLASFLKITLPINVYSNITLIEMSIGQKYKEKNNPYRAILSWNIQGIESYKLKNMFRIIANNQIIEFNLMSQVFINEGYDENLYFELGGYSKGFWIIWKSTSFSIIPVKTNPPVFSFVIM